MENTEIIEFAKAAAGAAFDAHGVAGCSPDDAYDFMRNVAYECAENDLAAKNEFDRLRLSVIDMRLFRVAYLTEYADLRAHVVGDGLGVR